MQQIKEIEKEQYQNRQDSADRFNNGYSAHNRSRDKRLTLIKRGDFSCLKSVQEKFNNESKFIKLRRTKSTLSINSTKI